MLRIPNLLKLSEEVGIERGQTRIHCAINKAASPSRASTKHKQSQLYPPAREPAARRKCPSRWILTTAYQAMHY